MPKYCFIKGVSTDFATVVSSFLISETKVWLIRKPRKISASRPLPRLSFPPLGPSETPPVHHSSTLDHFQTRPVRHSSGPSHSQTGRLCHSPSLSHSKKYHVFHSSGPSDSQTSHVFHSLSPSDSQTGPVSHSPGPSGRHFACKSASFALKACLMHCIRLSHPIKAIYPQCG